MTTVGMVGTFDVQNFGDLLFPLVAEHELRRRFPDLELHRFSYSERREPEWPFRVRSLADLAEMIDALDLLLVGGGDVIRFDQEVAPGYGPPTSDMDHPTAYWLQPTLIAALAGVPVAWNAVGVLPRPDWARPLLRASLQCTDYIAVRDQYSRREAKAHTDRRVLVVPDTAMCAATLAHREAARLELSAAGVGPGYIVVEPGPWLHDLELATGAGRDLADGSGRIRLRCCNRLLPVSQPGCSRRWARSSSIGTRWLHAWASGCSVEANAR